MEADFGSLATHFGFGSPYWRQSNHGALSPLRGMFDTASLHVFQSNRCSFTNFALTKEVEFIEHMRML